MNRSASLSHSGSSKSNKKLVFNGKSKKSCCPVAGQKRDTGSGSKKLKKLEQNKRNSNDVHSVLVPASEKVFDESSVGDSALPSSVDTPSEAFDGTFTNMDTDTDSAVLLEMSCDSVDPDKDSPVWFNAGQLYTYITPTKVRVTPKSRKKLVTDDVMPLLNKETLDELTPVPEVVCPSLIVCEAGERTKPATLDMPILERVDESAFDKNAPLAELQGSAQTTSQQSESNVEESKSASPPGIGNSKMPMLRRRRTSVEDRCYGYDTREWKIPKLTIRCRRASGNNADRLRASPVSPAATSPRDVVYEILQDSPAESTRKSSSPFAISPSQFYDSARLKKLHLQIGDDLNTVSMPSAHRA